MTHPEANAVGVLSVALAAVGCVIVAAFAAVACRNAHRFLPSPRARTVYWVGLALTLPLPFVALFMGEALRNLAVIPSFGWDAYAGGLRSCPTAVTCPFSGRRRAAPGRWCSWCFR